MLQNTLTRVRQARRDDSGFTLIELVIVILILGVLAGVVVFSVSGINNRGTEAACKTEVRTVETAIEAYRADNDAYPTTVGDLVGNFLRNEPTGPSTITNATTVDATGAMPAGATTC
ncbi:type II secretion system protein [Nocardioides sp. NPDC057577]|uniref:type II secretion system protein n=1 Tax=Nocardioides sp. NPDC057577 TaxID=3346171 RepID=UPI00366DE177